MDIAALDPIERLSRDLREAATTLSDDEARFLVDAYYSMQEDRKRSDNQVRALSESGEPNRVLEWFATQSGTLEKQVAAALDRYSNAHPVGRWARSQVGIGPVISAGLLAHIDIEKCNTAGKLWRFAGLDPSQKWEKGKKRPWNAALKTLCWKIGESFVKVSGNEEAFYGAVYVKRKALETERNEAGANAEAAARVLTEKKIGKGTEAYKAYSIGKLPPAHIHARAKRYAVKLFLAHFQEVAFRERYNTAPPLPYPIAHMGHVDYIAPPQAKSIE